MKTINPLQTRIPARDRKLSEIVLLECPAAVTASERKTPLHHSFKPPIWRRSVIDHLDCPPRVSGSSYSIREEDTPPSQFQTPYLATARDRSPVIEEDHNLPNQYEM
ncbi:hypothetical protein CDAR_317531 [Caerostris darwini]|uniref:Uncharacterized protein n=1 Tax=Caerostris darwini TaxID=1538125 RepID=A0AAV4SIS5_9ARAC|nr:hypothetical protein CDAR_317531 [Caerostris darwini]